MKKKDRQTWIEIGGGYTATLLEIQNTWALVTKNPQVTLRQLASVTGLGITKLRHLTDFLKRAGYIEAKPFRRRGMTPVIPLVEIGYGRYNDSA